MSTTKTMKVPDLGDFSDVEIIEVLVSSGDELQAEDPLITLETDKATMDVPITEAGVVTKVLVSVGDRVSKGSPVIEYEVSGADASDQSSETAEEEEAGDSSGTAPDEKSSDTSTAGEDDSSRDSGAPRSAAETGDGDATTGLVVIGAGPGGYSAAFRAADLGLDVTLVERWPVLGGVCLNVGCIPSKALLHAAKVIDDAAAMSGHGIAFGKPRIDASALRGWKNEVVGKLTGGLTQLARQRKVKVVHGEARFRSANQLELDNGETIDFEHCIIAAGSESAKLPGTPDDPRIVDSTGALELEPLPKRMLVVGGGIIGLEMACVYAALGTRISVVELTPNLMPEADQDLLRPFRKIINERYEAIMLETKVTGMRATVPGIEVTF
ncbi:MAG: FAD-dependent oxidoreductase, partial [Woeseia sp.]